MSQIREYFKMAVGNIRANKMRSFLTMLGIIIGISSVILIMSLGNGAKSVITDEMSGIAAGQIYLYTYDMTGTYSITDDDLDAIMENIPEIKAVETSLNVEGKMTTRKGDFTVSAVGQKAGYQVFYDDEILNGRYFTESEYISGARVCVIGENDAIRIFGSTDVVGKEITADIWNTTLSLRIVGVEKAPEDSFLNFTYDNSPVSVCFPLSVFSQTFGINVTSHEGVYLLAAEGADTSKTTSQVVNLLEKRHQCAGEDIFQFESFNDYMAIINTVINMVTLIISLVAAISLIVGGIGVMNIMLVSVTERTREIGIRKALGAKTKSIMMQFLSESAIITMIGGAIGITVGILSAYGVAAIVGMINPQLTFTPQVSIPTILLTTLFSSAIGLFFGIYPAKKAAKLSPIEALRRL